MTASATTSDNFFYAYDGNGNVRALVKADALTPAASAIVERYVYDGFGRELAGTAPIATSVNSFRFSTKMLDVESGMNYYGYRYYASADGRWINRDLIQERGGLCIYGFIDNNPIIFIDLFGLTGIFEDNPGLGKCGKCPDKFLILIGGALDSKTGVASDYIRSDATYGWDAEFRMTKDIRELHRICPSTKISIIGHSYGASTAVVVMDNLNGEVSFENLVTLDAVSHVEGHRLNPFVSVKPDNVDNWTNVYNHGTSLDDGFATAGGHWGHESDADVNVRVRDTNHGSAADQFNRSGAQQDLINKGYDPKDYHPIIPSQTKPPTSQP